MKKLALALSIVFCMLCFAACSTKAPTVTAIEFNIDNLKTVYSLNESLDPEGGYIVVSYSDNTNETIKITDAMISGFDSSVTGEKVITVTYQDIKFEVKLRIKNNREVDFYITTGTLPTLFSGLNLLSTDNPSYFIYERQGTFNNEKLPNNVKEVYDGTVNGNLLKIKKTIAKLYAENNDVHFNLYCDDLRVQWGIQMLEENFIPENQYNVILLSDGIATYDASFAKMYAQDNTYNLWKTNAENYESVREKADNRLETNLSFVIASHDLDNAMIYASQRKNYEYWMQYPEYLTSLDANVQKEIDKAHLIKKEPNAMFDSLTNAKKAEFYDMVNIDKTLFDSYFNNSSKPDLLISGTSTSSSGNFKAYMQWVIDTYGDDYDLFFKPHPVHLPVSGAVIDKDFLDNNGIVILPGKLPMEALLWCYPDVKIGGYKSSLYMSATSSQVLFFLGVSDGSQLPSPINELVDKGLFADAEYIVK